MANVNGTFQGDDISPTSSDPKLQTTAQDDTINGFGGDDTIVADGGNDTIDGGQGSDAISGGAGNDVVNLASTSSIDTDSVYGDGGDDTFNVSNGDGTIYIEGGSGVDAIVGGGFSFSGNLVVNMEDGKSVESITDINPGNLTLYTGNNTASDYTVVETSANVFDVTLPGGGTVTIDASFIGFQDFSETDILNAMTQTLPSGVQANPLCLTTGTHVLCEGGERPVEEISEGDLVMTRDHGLQAVRWVGRRTMPAVGTMAPVVIEAGALGNTRDLTVSQQHRMLVKSARAELLLGESEVLVAAVDMTNDERINRREGGEVTYIHLAFDRHELIYAEGTLTESLQPTAKDADKYGAAYAELQEIFPELSAQNTPVTAAAGRIVSQSEARVLL